MSKKYYVVWRGRIPGVYDDWADAEEQIRAFPGAAYKGFDSSAAATEAYRQGTVADDAGQLAAFLGRMRTRQKEKSHGDYRLIAEIDQTAWAVDAACAKNPGPVEYQGVDLATGRRIFHYGPIPDGTNNIGEFLAIVHALALMDAQCISRTIYSDSRTAIAWVRNARIRTTLKRTPRNALLFTLMERALIWLNTHSFRAPILKWDTDHWGEIPADFGRK